jgi:DNA-directed RNA polymerase subunit beta
MQETKQKTPKFLEEITSTGRNRLDFAKIPTILEIPNLIEIQQESYEKFLQINTPPEQRKDIGLQEVFKSVFPIVDFNEMARLEFDSYYFLKPKYEVNECRERGMTYAAPLKVKVRLVTWEQDEQTKAKSVRDIKEQDIYFGEIPLMTPKGTFIINGTERTVVSQMHRSPGIFFSHDKGKTHASGKILYSARVIPYRGSWLELEFDYKDYLYVRIDKKRKILVSTFIRALQYIVEEEIKEAEERGETLPDSLNLDSTENILRTFYDIITFKFDEVDKSLKGQTCSVVINPDLKVSSPDALDEFLRGFTAATDVIAPDGTVILEKDKKITKKALKLSKQHQIKEIPVYSQHLTECVVAKDIVDPETGEIILACNEEISEEAIARIVQSPIQEIEVLLIDNSVGGDALSNAFKKDPIKSKDEALIEIYRTLRPGDPPTLDSAKKLFKNLFFNPERYDLSRVGRLKVNEKLKLNKPLDHRTLDSRDLIEIIKYMLRLRMGEGNIDDIDHLGNRRVRSVGELLENQFRIGLVRMERATKERMSLQELDTVMPHDLINAKPVTNAVKEFFGSSQLSQFMDQTNPLSELTHKRRLSALGPGGLSRERAEFEMRDVHPTHYGRICPVETPEGPNIGLIASLSTYARINDFGFIETPYRKVVKDKDGTVRVTNEIEFLAAFKDEQYTIAQASAEIDEEGRFIRDRISARRRGEFVMVPPDQVDYMDVSPKQLVSVSASLIPFLENDDANRALMGSNMQRQAVPLLKTDAPLVGTGMERIAARDSGALVIARRSGVVEDVDSRRIVIRADGESEIVDRYATNYFQDSENEANSMVDIYNLTKFQRSNQNTCINQTPLVKIGERVKAGQVIADGFATDHGELALGRNVLVAFMPWGGYNFEDAILVSEKVVKEDLFTSIHIEECEIEARDTKLGREEITRDIPNVSEEALRNLDESGIIRIGAEVKPGDILVGKVTPKGETQLSPEEKLLRAIFGEKAGDVKDASLYTPQGIEGVVIDVKVFSRKGIEKDERALSIEDAEIAKIIKDYEDEIKIVKDELRKKLISLLKGKVVAKDYVDPTTQEVLLSKGEKITPEKLASIPTEDFNKIKILEIQDVKEEMDQLQENAMDQIHILETIMNEKTGRLKTGDELPPGVVKLVKVYIAVKRKLSVGDKMAGRHGNKGVVAKILPEEDMPYLPDGTPIEIILNPLGVPSRMNVGQILETHLGWACRELGKKVAQYLKELEAWDKNSGSGASDSVASGNGQQPSDNKQQTLQKLKDLIKGIYNGTRIAKEVEAFLNEATEEEVKNLARSLKDNVYVASPVFDGIKEETIREKLRLAGLPETGKTTLYDGRTGEAFDQEVTVGYIYMMKLSHLVDDKMHARSIGPYSLVTQQPLGGKAQFGGQRFGEMEVWALEAYGAAYNLQELLTVKSDDVVGRTKIYEAIVKGRHVLEPGVPESFNVLVKELQSLALDVELIQQS